MGVEKYSDNLTINRTKEESCGIMKSILKRLIYSIQYESSEKGIIIAKVESDWHAPAGELIIIDLNENKEKKTTIIFLSKDLIPVSVNFDRNVKNVNRLIKELKKVIEYE